MWPSHGSNPQYLYEALGMPLPDHFLDFSANINPLGPPDTLKKEWNGFYHKIMVYPDPFASKLKQQISHKEQVSTDSLLIGNGGSEMISLIARLLQGKKVLLVQPSFSEYEKACRENRCKIDYHQLEEPSFELDLDLLRPKVREADAMFFCNPNNPTGIQYPASSVLELMEECEKHHCLFILDEAFYDFLQEYQSFMPYINRFSNFIIIRSMTKMFAIPGIRLGYIAANPATIAKLQKSQTHWSTNVIALLAGELCIEEDDFIKKTQTYISKERSTLFAQFQQQGYLFSASNVNFYLLRDPYLHDQLEFFLFLLKRGIIPRHTFNFPGLAGKWLRFAIKTSQENQQLMEVLDQWRQHHH